VNYFSFLQLHQRHDLHKPNTVLLLRTRCCLQFGAVARTIGMGAAAGREYPNTAFVFNTDDLSVCTSKEACPAPMFSIYKRQDHLDLLLPVSPT
jgi:hypothetical protein